MNNLVESLCGVLYLSSDEWYLGLNLNQVAKIAKKDRKAAGYIKKSVFQSNGVKVEVLTTYVFGKLVSADEAKRKFSKQLHIVSWIEKTKAKYFIVDETSGTIFKPKQDGGKYFFVERHVSTVEQKKRERLKEYVLKTRAIPLSMAMK